MSETGNFFQHNMCLSQQVLLHSGGYITAAAVCRYVSAGAHPTPRFS